MAPWLLICSKIVWAHQELNELAAIMDIVYLDSPDCKSFLAQFGSDGKYENTVGIYRENESSEKIGNFNEDLINGFPSSVKWIAHNETGYDPVDVHACKAQGIYLSNTPSSVNDATTTMALYLLLATFCQFSLTECSLRELKWKPKGISLRTHDITGKTLTILSLRGIRMHFAVLAHAFLMCIIYHSRRQNPKAQGFEYFENVEEMLRQTDVLSIHVPLRSDMIGLIGERWIRSLKPGAVIINTARGKIIDEEVIIQALRDGHLSAVGLDVHPNEPVVNPHLLTFPNVTLLPHMGTETKDTQEAMEVCTLTNLLNYFTAGMGKDLVMEYMMTPKL